MTMQTPLKETPAARSSSGLFKLAPRRFVLESGESASHPRGCSRVRLDSATAPSAALAIVAAMLLNPARAAAQACCGGTPQGSLAAVTRLPGNAGTVAISFDWELRQLDKPERTSGPALAPLLDQRLTMQLYTVAAEVAVTSWAAAAAVVPLSLNHQSVTLPDATNLSGTAAGIGDTTLLAKLRVLAPGAGSNLIPTVVAVGGVRAPTGPSALQSEQLGIFSPSIQPGTGAWAGVFGVSAVELLSSPLSPRPWNLYGSVLGSYSAANSRRYRLGPSLSYGLGVGVLLWHRLALQAGVAGVVVAADHSSGDLVNDTGSHQLWVAPTATWTIVPHLRAYAGAQLPIWRSLNGTQLVGAYSVLAGALVSFSAWGGG